MKRKVVVILEISRAIFFFPGKTYIVQCSISSGRSKLLVSVDLLNIIPGSKFPLELLYQILSSPPPLLANKMHFLSFCSY